MLKSLLLSISIISVVHSMDITPEAAVNPEMPLKKEIVPNFFKDIEKDTAFDKINLCFSSILNRLLIPHVDPVNQKLTNEKFIIKLDNFVQERAPGAKVYIGGGVVRSLLGYIYKKIFNAYERGIPENNLNTFVLQALDDIIEGKSRKNQSFDKKLDSLHALGVNSDFDVYIDFPQNFNGDYTKVKLETQDFINSGESHLGLRNNQGELKKSLILVGDVKDYNKQLGQNEKSAVIQGGSTLDWLAFPITPSEQQVFRFPIGHENILNRFFDGQLDYIAPKTKLKDPDKQTIRGLRSLLELYFLSLTPEGSNVMVAELTQLINQKNLSYGAREQISKMLRNSWCGGGHNRFTRPRFLVSNPEISERVQTLSDTLGPQPNNIPLVPEFLPIKKIMARKEDKGTLTQLGYLTSLSTLLDTYTDKGLVYHGTADLKNVLYMIRKNLIVSSDKQGRAAFGQGFYTTKDIDIAKQYSSSQGMPIPLKINPHPNLRILDLNTQKAQELLKDISVRFPDKDPNFILSEHYDIDIIVTKETNYLLIQNTDALILPKDKIALVKAQIENINLDIISTGSSFCENKLTTWLEYLHPKYGYMTLLSYLDPNSSLDGFGYLTPYFKNILQQEHKTSLPFVLYILSKGKDFWSETSSGIKNYEMVLTHLHDYVTGLLGYKPNRHLMETFLHLCTHDLIELRIFDATITFTKIFRLLGHLSENMLKELKSQNYKDDWNNIEIIDILKQFIIYQELEARNINPTDDEKQKIFDFIFDNTHLKDNSFIDITIALLETPDIQKTIDTVHQLKELNIWSLLDVLSNMKLLAQKSIPSFETLELIRNLKECKMIRYPDLETIVFLFPLFNNLKNHAHVFKILQKMKNEKGFTIDINRSFRIKEFDEFKKWIDFIDTTPDQADDVLSIYETLVNQKIIKLNTIQIEKLITTIPTPQTLKMLQELREFDLLECSNLMTIEQLFGPLNSIRYPECLISGLRSLYSANLIGKISSELFYQCSLRKSPNLISVLGSNPVSLESVEILTKASDGFREELKREGLWKLNYRELEIHEMIEFLNEKWETILFLNKMEKNGFSGLNLNSLSSFQTLHNQHPTEKDAEYFNYLFQKNYFYSKLSLSVSLCQIKNIISFLNQTNNPEDIISVLDLVSEKTSKINLPDLLMNAAEIRIPPYVLENMILYFTTPKHPKLLEELDSFQLSKLMTILKTIGRSENQIFLEQYAKLIEKYNSDEEDSNASPFRLIPLKRSYSSNFYNNNNRRIHNYILNQPAKKSIEIIQNLLTLKKSEIEKIIQGV